MSKTTKIIAALGVVAGLGVAALPAFTYAVETTGNVEVDVEVLPAIAMTIEGNNDNGEYYNPTGATYSYTAVTPAGTENPSTEGWYERTNNEEPYQYAKSTDTTIDSGKTYYKRTSSAFQPVDNAAPGAMAGEVIDYHNVPDPLVSGVSSSYASLLPNSVVEGGAFKSTITVYTNSTSGYNLTLKDSDTTTALTQIVSEGTPDTIPATSATTLTGGTAAWGYRVGTFGDWLAVPASNAVEAASIGSENVKTDHGTAYTVEYGVATDADQATGIYTDVIVYTATTK